jgi:hypothetical protein
VQVKSRSVLVAVLVTSAVALLDAWTGGHAILLDGEVEAVVAGSSLGAALDRLVGRLLEHAGGRLDDDLALVLAQPRLLRGRTA